MYIVTLNRQTFFFICFMNYQQKQKRNFATINLKSGSHRKMKKPRVIYD